MGSVREEMEIGKHEQIPGFTYSSASWPWLDEPTTPPFHERSLYNCVPLPSQRQNDAEENIVINPVIRYNGVKSPRAELDVSLSLSEFAEPYRGCLSETATYPPLPSLAVKMPNIPRVAIVHHSGPEYVTVGDVLEAIYGAIQVQNCHEYGKYKAESRYQGEQWSSGRKGRDPLRGKRVFTGLSESKIDSETFDMHVE